MTKTVKRASPTKDQLKTMQFLSSKTVLKKLKIRRETLVLLLILTLSAAGLLLFYQNLIQRYVADLNQKPLSSGNETAIAADPIPTTLLPQGQLPVGITEDLILKQDGEIMESYEYEKDGLKYSALKFVSALSQAELFPAYRLKLQDLGWSVYRLSDDNAAGVSSLSASHKESFSTLGVVITRGAGLKTQVELSLSVPLNPPQTGD